MGRRGGVVWLGVRRARSTRAYFGAVKLMRSATEAASTYARPAALTVLTVAAGSRILAHGSRGKIEFVVVAANAAAQPDFGTGRH